MSNKKVKFYFIVLFSFLLFSCNSTTRFNEEKETIYHMLKKHYVGFSEMKKQGFTKDAWKKVSNYDEIKNLFDKCINDTHLSINNNNGFEYKQNQVFDKDSIKSDDPYPTFIKKTTSNTYYLRYNSCNINWPDYANFPNLAYEALKYDYIVLDFRSNSGGGNGQQYEFFRNLYVENYKGKIFVTQDNWSYSAGEVWIMASQFKDFLDLTLIGTHSGGMQIYGNCVSYEENGIFFYLPSTSFANNLPENYLGEGKGYEPDIWANKENMKSKLESLGLDLSGIEFN